jgi:hypothetical protein
MHAKTATTSRSYLYAIISGSEERSFGPLGLKGGEVRTIVEGDVGAVISDVSDERIRPERRNLTVHQEVLVRLMKETTPLPMSFGIIANDRNAIRKVLSRNHEEFTAQLKRVAGKVEMGLRVALSMPNIFEYFVDTHQELKDARDMLHCAHREPTHDDKIEIGRLFDRMLNEDREAYTDSVKEILSGHCFEFKINKCRNEREVMNLACLVGRDAQPEFESSVFESARLFDNNFAFDYSGPWAPHNFVEMQLKL